MSDAAPDPKPLAASKRAVPRRGTGPRSAAGKAVVSRNAVKHGLFSASPIAASVENQADWDHHLNAVFHSLAPVGHLETVLAERVALQFWRLARIARYEAATVEAAQQALALHIQGHRFQLENAAPTTHADLSQARADAMHAEQLLESLPNTAPNDPVDVETVLFALDAHVRAAAIDDPCAFLHAAQPGQSLPEYVHAHVWIGADLLAALADVAHAAGLVFEDLNARAVRRATDHSMALCVALSDQDIATRKEMRLLPDDATLERVQRFEAHLSRETSRTLRELERLQDRRAGKQPAPVLDLNVNLNP